MSCRHHTFRPSPLSRWILLALALACCAGCHAAPQMVRLPLAEEGELFLYLQPAAVEARALQLEVGEITALRSDGSEHPLGVRLQRIDAATTGRQRFLASGVLPPGLYRGITLRLSRALLKKGGGEVALTPADKPVLIPFSFEVKRKKASLLYLTLRRTEALKEGARFVPSFTVSVPERPLITLTGYVTNSGANTVTVFDKKEGSVRGIIATGQGPRGVAIDPKKRLAYVALAGEDAIEVIDLLSHEIVNRIRLVYGDQPGEIALTADGRTLLTVNTGSNSVSFVDPATLLETARVNVGKIPVSLLLDASGSRAYVINNLSDSISIIDLASRSVISTIPTESGPLRAAFNRGGDRLLVIHQWSPNLAVIDPLSGAMVKRVFVGMGLISVKVDPLTDNIYLGQRNNPVVQVFDPYSLVASDFLTAAGGAVYLSFDADSSNVLLLLPDQGALEAVNLISKEAQYLIDVDRQPFRSSIMGER